MVKRALAATRGAARGACSGEGALSQYRAERKRVRRLNILPRQLLVRIVDPSSLGGQRIGDLDDGVIPIEPDTVVSFEVQVAKLNKKWFDAACPSLLPLALSLSPCLKQVTERSN